MKQRIAFTTDLHGYREAYKKIENFKEANSDIVLIDNGDFFIGSNESLFEVAQKEVSMMTKIANKLGYKAIVVGNHDLDAGLEYLLKENEYLDAELISCNIYDLNHQLLFKPSLVIEDNKKKIAIIGATTQNLTQLSHYDITKDFIVKDPIEAINKQIKALVNEVDEIIVSYHGGIERNLLTGDWTQYDTKEDQGYEIALSCPNILGVVCGHQHRINYGKVNKVTVLQPGYKGSHIALYDGDDFKLCELPEVPPINAQSDEYKKWLTQTVDIEAFKAYVKTKIECDDVYIKSTGNTIKDFLIDLKAAPFSLNLFELSKQEYGTDLNKREPYQILSNANLSHHRLKRHIYEPIVLMWFMDGQSQ